MPYETVTWEQSGAVGRLTLNRPDSLNAWTPEFGNELRQALERDAASESVRAVLITGAGRGFSSGADLKSGFEPADDGLPNLRKELNEIYHPVITAVRRIEKPVIAAVNGPAVGIGCSLALACDLIMAAESAFFGLAFVNIGLMPDGGSTAFVPPAVGRARAFQMALLGERIPAPQALEWGLVNWVYPDDRLLAEADALVSGWPPAPRAPTRAQSGRSTSPSTATSTPSSASRPSSSTRSDGPRTSSRAPQRSSRSARRRSPADSRMADWATISSLATAGGTLVLAVATFASVRSANRSARIAEIALQEQRRPLLAGSRLEDPDQKIMFVDQHWVRVTGAHAVVEHVDGMIYLVMSLRNVGAGIGVCQGWAVRAGLTRMTIDHIAEDELRAQTRDLYIPAGDIGLWQGALRDREDPHHREVADAIARREPITVELLYSDQVGAQRTITRFTLAPLGQDGADNGVRVISAGRHWYLDRAGPR